jgi:hypothetical protein
LYQSLQTDTRLKYGCFLPDALNSLSISHIVIQLCTVQNWDNHKWPMKKVTLHHRMARVEVGCSHLNTAAHMSHVIT